MRVFIKNIIIKRFYYVLGYVILLDWGSVLGDENRLCEFWDFIDVFFFFDLFL